MDGKGEKMLIQRVICSNCNHWKSNVLVRFCSMCGEVVNKNIQIIECTEEEHKVSRRKRNKYCVDCGEQLVLGLI